MCGNVSVLEAGGLSGAGKIRWYFVAKRGSVQLSEKILVVDDEKEIADLVEVYLKNEGYTVCKCFNAADALAFVRQEDICLAILDVMLPDLGWVSSSVNRSGKPIFSPS